MTAAEWVTLIIVINNFLSINWIRMYSFRKMWLVNQRFKRKFRYELYEMFRKSVTVLNPLCSDVWYYWLWTDAALTILNLWWTLCNSEWFWCSYFELWPKFSTLKSVSNFVSSFVKYIFSFQSFLSIFCEFWDNFDIVIVIFTFLYNLNCIVSWIPSFENNQEVEKSRKI